MRPLENVTVWSFRFHEAMDPFTPFSSTFCWAALQPHCVGNRRSSQYLHPDSDLWLRHGRVTIITWRMLALSERNFGKESCLYCSASTSSAKNPRHLGSLADFTNAVFWEVSIKTVFPWCHFHKTLRIWVKRTACGCRHFCIFEIICELLWLFRKISQTVVRRPIAIPLLSFVSGFWWITRPVSWSELVISLWCWAWRCTWWCAWRVLRWRCRGWTRTRTWTTIQGQQDVRKFILASFCLFCLVNRGCLPLDHSVFFAKFSKW